MASTHSSKNRGIAKIGFLAFFLGGGMAGYVGTENVVFHLSNVLIESASLFRPSANLILEFFHICLT